MEKKRRRFRYDAANVLIGKVLILGVSMLSSIYFARILKAEGRGELSVVTSVAGVLVQFCNFGLHSAHTYYISKDRTVQDKAEGNIIIVSVICIILSLLCYPFLVLFPNLLKISPFLIVMSLALFVVNLATMLQENLFLAIGNIFQYNLMQVMNQIIIVVLVVCASIWFDVNVYIVAVVSVFASILVLCFSLLDKTIIKPNISIVFFKSVLPYGAKSFISCLVCYLLLRTDIFMLNYYLSKKDVGLYSLAVSLSDMLYMFSSSVSTVLFPKLSTFETIGKKFNMIKKVMKVMIPVIIGVALGLGAFARYIITILYGHEYSGSIILMRVLLISSVAWAVSGFVFNFYAAENKFMECIVIPLIGFVINIITNFALINRIGAMGAAIASDISYIFVAVSMFLCMYNYVKKHDSRNVSVVGDN